MVWWCIYLWIKLHLHLHQYYVSQTAVFAYRLLSDQSLLFIIKIFQPVLVERKQKLFR